MIPCLPWQNQSWQLNFTPLRGLRGELHCWLECRHPPSSSVCALKSVAYALIHQAYALQCVVCHVKNHGIRTKTHDKSAMTEAILFKYHEKSVNDSDKIVERKKKSSDRTKKS